MAEPTAPRPQDIPDDLIRAVTEGLMGLEVRRVIANVWPEIERQVREQVAAEQRAAAQAIEDSRGENRDLLAEEIWQTCERDPEVPAVREDPRTIAAVAYRHIAYRIAGEAR